MLIPMILARIVLDPTTSIGWNLNILHASMMNEDWVKAELDNGMHTYMESGKRNRVLITIDFVD